MSIDPYSECPGGTGKKVKFCCPDLVHELDQVNRMLEGNQPQACLDYIEGVEKKCAGRACLTTIKASLQSELGQTDAARQTVENLLQAQPDNPVALADAALFAVEREGAVAALKMLHRSLSASDGRIAPQVYSAIGEIAMALLRSGRYLAARRLFLLMTMLNPEDANAAEMVVRMSTPREVPLLFKDDPNLHPAPADAPWKEEHTEISRLIGRLRWVEAEQKLTALSQRIGNSPVAWHNLALVRGWLADEAGMKDALRALAALDAPREVPLDDAIEAEALAQLVDPVVIGDKVDELIVTYPITDIEKLASHLASDKRFKSAPLQLMHSNPDAPPPRSVYWLLDKPVPASGKDLTLDAVPNILATLGVFGRETDREARVEVECNRGDISAAAETLVALAGDSLGIRGGEEVFGHIPRSQTLLSWNWRLPDDTPSEHVENLIAQQRRQVVLNRWPKAPQAVLGGKSADEAARDPAQRIKVSGALLLLELALDHPTAMALVNELRGRLGLPVSYPIDPATVDVKRLSLVRLSRLMMDKLSDDDLVITYQRTVFTMARFAARKASLELLQRTSLADKISKASIYGQLSRLEDDEAKACEYLVKAREEAEASNQSAAPWALEELTIRIRSGQSEQAAELLRNIQSRYGRDPQVRSALAQILMAFGIIGPDGRPAGGMPSATVEPGGGVRITPSAPAAAETGKIWTPGSEVPSSGGKKSALWTPDS